MSKICYFHTSPDLTWISLTNWTHQYNLVYDEVFKLAESKIVRTSLNNISCHNHIVVKLPEDLMTIFVMSFNAVILCECNNDYIF